MSHYRDDIETWIEEKARSTIEVLRGPNPDSGAGLTITIGLREMSQLRAAIYDALLSAVMRERERCAQFIDSNYQMTPRQLAAAIRTAETPNGE